MKRARPASHVCLITLNVSVEYASAVLGSTVSPEIVVCLSHARIYGYVYVKPLSGVE